MNSSPDLQEARKLEAIKNFDDLTEEQQRKIENDLIWRFLEK
ncbi:MAG: hypothetical protein PHU71_01430 [Candidatus Gracilibacteria bacterium]|nr:hypothetical protein [Candidatus Gracilibacteria bacterium]